MTKEDTAERVVQFLVEHAQCTDCDCSYRAEDVHVLAHRQERIWELAAVCNNCYTLSLIRAVIKGQPGRQAHVARLTRRELTAAEERHFEDLPPVDADDVLDVTAFLTDFDGDFRSLFGKESEES